MDAAHLRIAITTNSLVAVDANFASAKQMVFYDVTRDASEFVDVVKFNRFGKKGIGGGQGGADGRCVMDDMGDDDGAGHDPLVERVESLAGCSVVFTLGLSDLAAVRIHNERVFPVKSAQVRDIEDVIGNLQRLMNGTPPLWLRRVLRDAQGNRLPLDEQEILTFPGAMSSRAWRGTRHHELAQPLWRSRAAFNSLVVDCFALPSPLAEEATAKSAPDHCDRSDEA